MLAAAAIKTKLDLPVDPIHAQALRLIVVGMTSISECPRIRAATESMASRASRSFAFSSPIMKRTILSERRRATETSLAGSWAIGEQLPMLSK